MQNTADHSRAFSVESKLSKDNVYAPEELVNLSNALTRRLGPEYISTRPGPGGCKVHYIEGWKAINLANQIFGFNGWSSSVQAITVDYFDEGPGGKICLGISATVRITLKDGTFHEDIGYGNAENMRGKGNAYCKAKKEAITDALKRALRTFGDVMGNCLYDKNYLQQIQKVKTTPIPKIDEDQLHRPLESVTNKSPPMNIDSRLSAAPFKQMPPDLTQNAIQQETATKLRKDPVLKSTAPTSTLYNCQTRNQSPTDQSQPATSDPLKNGCATVIPTLFKAVPPNMTANTNKLVVQSEQFINYSEDEIIENEFQLSADVSFTSDIDLTTFLTQDEMNGMAQDIDGFIMEDNDLSYKTESTDPSQEVQALDDYSENLAQNNGHNDYQQQPKHRHEQNQQNQQQNQDQGQVRKPPLASAQQPQSHPLTSSRHSKSEFLATEASRNSNVQLTNQGANFFGKDLLLIDVMKNYTPAQAVQTKSVLGGKKRDFDETVEGRAGPLTGAENRASYSEIKGNPAANGGMTTNNHPPLQISTLHGKNARGYMNMGYNGQFVGNDNSSKGSGVNNGNGYIGNSGYGGHLSKKTKANVI